MAGVNDFLIDFKDEEEGGGGGLRVKEGTYRVKVVAAKPTVSAEKGTHGLELTLAFADGKYKGKKLKETLWASPKAYSRFRTLLEAVGKKVPSKIKLGVIAKAVKGTTLYVEVQDDEREGYSTRSRVTFQGFISEDDYDSDDVGDEDEDDEEDDEDEDEEDEDLEDEEDEEEEEEEEPPKKKRSAKKKPAPAAAKKRSKRKKDEEDEDDDEDLEDLDLEDL